MDTTTTAGQGSAMETLTKATKMVQDKVHTAWDMVKRSLNKFTKPAGTAGKPGDGEL
jgi:hypothetical protein